MKRSTDLRGIRGLKKVVVKLDMNKACDRVEWIFLRKTLMSFGFHEYWVGKILALVYSVFYIYQVNDFLGNILTPEGP